MKFTYQGKAIKGCLCVVPDRVLRFEDELNNFNAPEKQSRRLAKTMGFDEHRLCDQQTAASDLCAYGLTYLVQKGFLQKERISAIVVASTSQDYPMPGISTLLGHALGLGEETYCLDLLTACTGYIVGLSQALALLDQPQIDQVLLINADVLGKCANPKDRNTYPLLGDAAAITLLGRDPDAERIHISLRNDGSRLHSLYIPAGGSRLPFRDTLTVPPKIDEFGNEIYPTGIHMDGTAVFQFVTSDVPPMVEDLLAYAGKEKGGVDYFLCHQPNRFILHKLAEEMGVPKEKLFSNIVEKFGNSSGSTIPMAMAYNLGPKLIDGTFEVCMASFGAGLTWGSASLRLGGLGFCEWIEHPGGGANRYPG